MAVVGVGPIWNFTKENGFSHAPVGHDGTNYAVASARQSTGGSLFGLAPILYLSLAPIEAEEIYIGVPVFYLGFVWVSQGLFDLRCSWLGVCI